MRISSLLLVGAVSLGLAACSSAPPRGFDQADRTAIDTFIQDFVTSYNAKDSQKVAQAFTDNGAVMPPNASTVRGTVNVQIYYDKRFTQGATDLKLETTDVIGDGGLAVASGNYWLNMAPAGAEARRDRGKFIFVMREGNNRWGLERLMFSSDFAPEGGAN